MAPLADDRSGRCCHDCASADLILRYDLLPYWEMARIAVGNDRQEQLRLPGIPKGLVAMGIMRPSQPGAFKAHHAWLDLHEWFGVDPAEEP